VKRSWKAHGASETPAGRVAWKELRGWELGWRMWSPNRLREHAAEKTGENGTRGSGHRGCGGVDLEAFS
jgi:hypothetical protein